MTCHTEPPTSDKALLCALVEDQREVNRIDTRRVLRAEEFLSRLESDHQRRRTADPHFTLTPATELCAEVGLLTGISERRIRDEVDLVRRLRRHAPEVLELARSGRLDLYRAGIVGDALHYYFDGFPEVADEFGRRMGRWLLDHLAIGEENGLVTKTARQLHGKVRSLVIRLRVKDANERFRRGFAGRSVRVQSGEDGMAHLSASHDVASLTAADERLTMIAKALRHDDDPRTLAQLRADLLVDLLLGRLTVSKDGEVQQHRVGRWGRPVVNVTVPLETVAGLSDAPGVLNGTDPLPAALVRAIAQDPECTWYRLLTDPVQGNELSTSSYTPTEAIWRSVVADRPTCFFPGCHRPAAACDLDHARPWPVGSTSTRNLHPACRRHHHGKHLDGASLTTDPDGTLRYRTRAGFSHVISREEQPVFDASLDRHCASVLEGEFTAAEITDAVELLRAQRHAAQESIRFQVELEQLIADYRASYPSASEDDIEQWLYDDDPRNDPPPPILRRGVSATIRAGADGLDLQRAYGQRG